MNNNVFFNFIKIKDEYLCVNEFGYYVFLKEKEFKKLLNKKSNNKILEEKQFFKNKLNLNLIYEYLYLKNNFSWKGPHTHLISLTKKCQNNCKYCSTNSFLKGKSLSFKKAKKIVDFILSIPQEEFFIEFTGGEPSLNFKIIKEIINYVNKNKKNKKIYFSIVTNLSYDNKKIINFFIKNNITVCSSLDGPKRIHDLLRPKQNGDGTYNQIIRNIKFLKEKSEKNIIEEPNLITTITKYSLGFEKEIIDEYVKLGISRFQFGTLEPLGRAKTREDIKITPEEYLASYKKAIKYILFLNKEKNIFIYEKGIYLLLYEIFKFNSNFKRSIDVYNRLAYDIDGNIYPSDEARMLGENSDKTLSIGNINESFRDLINKKETQAFLFYPLNKYLSPHCARCPYFSWCRTQGFYNYSAQNSFWGNMIISERCKIFKGIFKMIFEFISEKDNLKIFNNWLDKI